MMEIPKILNLYPLDKLRDRKSEGAVQKYTSSSFYLHVLEKALCPVFVKDTFSCRTKGASQVFCTCFSRLVLMSDNRDSSKPLACRNAVPISRVLAPICAHATYRTQRNFSADLPLCLPVLYVAGHGGRLAPLAAKHQTSLFSHFLSPDCCSGCSQRGGVVQD